MARSLNGNDFGVYIKKQTTKGEIPSNPDFDYVRRVSGRAIEEKSFVQSEEVKSNRQGKANIEDTTSQGAEITAETTKQTIEFLQSAIQGTEVQNTSTASAIASDADGFTGSGGSEFADFEEGDYVVVTGFADADLNTTYKITVKNSDDDIETLPAPASVEAAGASVTFTSYKTVNASDQDYYVIQNRIYDESQAGNTAYQTFYDDQIGQMTLEIGESGIIGNTVNFAGDSASKVDGLAIISGQTDNAKTTDDPLSASNNVTKFWVDGVSELCVIKSMSFDINNNLQDDLAAGCGTRRVNGDFTASASINARNTVDDSLRWLTDYKQGTTHEFAVELDHGSGDKTVIVISKGKITEHSIPDGGNTVANSEMTVAAEEAADNTTMKIFRNWS